MWVCLFMVYWGTQARKIHQTHPWNDIFFWTPFYMEQKSCNFCPKDFSIMQTTGDHLHLVVVNTYSRMGLKPALWTQSDDECHVESIGLQATWLYTDLSHHCSLNDQCHFVKLAGLIKTYTSQRTILEVFLMIQKMQCSNFISCRRNKWPRYRASILKISWDVTECLKFIWVCW